MPSLSRRTLLLAPLVLRAQPVRPKLIWVWLENEELPSEIADTCVVLPRFYMADPRADREWKAISSGKFPHAAESRDVTLEAFLNVVEVQSLAKAADLLTANPDALTVFTPRSGKGTSSREESIHVPFAVRLPGVLRPHVASGVLMSQVDVMPTLVSLSGLTPPADLHGRSVAALLKQEGGELPDSIFVQGPNFRVVIRGYDKLVTDLRGTPLRLYNLAEDPMEETDLVAEHSRELIRDALLALEQIWMRRIGDQVDPSGLRVR